jgi:hypothetical protein
MPSVPRMAIRMFRATRRPWVSSINSSLWGGLSSQGDGLGLAYTEKRGEGRDQG